MKFYRYHAEFANGRKIVMETGNKPQAAKRSAKFEAEGSSLVKFTKVGEFNA